MSYASYRHILREIVEFWPKIKIPLALDMKKLGIPIEKGKERITRQEKWQKIGALIIDQAVIWIMDWSTGLSGLGI